MYYTLESTIVPAEPAAKESIYDADETADNDETDDSDDTPQEDIPVNYGRLAFEWVDANMAETNTTKR